MNVGTIFHRERKGSFVQNYSKIFTYNLHMQMKNQIFEAT